MVHEGRVWQKAEINGGWENDYQMPNLQPTCGVEVGIFIGVPPPPLPLVPLPYASSTRIACGPAIWQSILRTCEWIMAMQPRNGYVNEVSNLNLLLRFPASGLGISLVEGVVDTHHKFRGTSDKPPCAPQYFSGRPDVQRYFFVPNGANRAVSSNNMYYPLRHCEVS